MMLEDDTLGNVISLDNDTIEIVESTKLEPHFQMQEDEQINDDSNLNVVLNQDNSNCDSQDQISNVIHDFNTSEKLNNDSESQEPMQSANDSSARNAEKHDSLSNMSSWTLESMLDSPISSPPLFQISNVTGSDSNKNPMTSEVNDNVIATNEASSNVNKTIPEEIDLTKSPEPEEDVNMDPSPGETKKVFLNFLS